MLIREKRWFLVCILPSIFCWTPFFWTARIQSMLVAGNSCESCSVGWTTRVFVDSTWYVMTTVNSMCAATFSNLMGKSSQYYSWFSLFSVNLICPVHTYAFLLRGYVTDVLAVFSRRELTFCCFCSRKRFCVSRERNGWIYRGTPKSLSILVRFIHHPLQSWSRTNQRLQKFRLPILKVLEHRPRIFQSVCFLLVARLWLWMCAIQKLQIPRWVRYQSFRVSSLIWAYWEPLLTQVCRLVLMVRGRHFFLEH